MSKRSSIPENQTRTVINNRGGPGQSLAHRRQPRHGPKSGLIVTVRVPISTRQQGTRKLVITPDTDPDRAPPRAHIDDTLIKAIVRAHRWGKALERDDYASMTELAKAEGVTESYLARILRLTLLSPRIIEAALDGRRGLPQLQQLVRPFSKDWQEQEARWL